MLKILSRDRETETIKGVWNGNRIYGTVQLATTSKDYALTVYALHRSMEYTLKYYQSVSSFASIHRTATVIYRTHILPTTSSVLITPVSSLLTPDSNLLPKQP
jgi:hypothetical protein